jgi:AmmeMemoRadiSam system protein B
MDVRKMVFAGSWYPESAPACETAIAEFTAPAPGKSDDGGPFIGGIVPHAGWVYSGRIACQVIKRLKEPDPIDVVVLFGMHLHEQSANYMMDQGAWATPLWAHTGGRGTGPVLKAPFSISTGNTPAICPGQHH